MKPEQTPITGKESAHEQPKTVQALIQFYRAFNHGDMELMAQNWEQSEAGPSPRLHRKPGIAGTISIRGA